MQISVKGKSIDVGAALSARITENLNDHLTRYYDRSLNAQATLSKAGSSFAVHLELHVPGEVLSAHADDADAYAAYDAAAHKLFAQVKKHKSRQKDHHSQDALVEKSISA